MLQRPVEARQKGGNPPDSPRDSQIQPSGECPQNSGHVPNGVVETVVAKPCTYFIRCSIGGNIKIGRTRDIAYRLMTLQMACPFALDLIGTLPGDREREFHVGFADARRHGEWFEPTTELLAFITSAFGPLQASPDLAPMHLPSVVVADIGREWERLCDAHAVPVTPIPDHLKLSLIRNVMRRHLRDAGLIPRLTASPRPAAATPEGSRERGRTC
jgi:hypothetical protein